ncbi:MAG: hypothetical protein KAR83_04535 [Thermodesulfovibrionales bacterium]|nr:hypothetical protein [Thermodesulfovibrionales bacterium]
MGGFRDEWLRVYDKLPFPVTVHDNDFNIVRANKSAKETLGLKGRKPWKCHKVFHGLDSPPDKCVCGWAGRKHQTTRDKLKDSSLAYLRIYFPRISDSSLVGSINIIIPEEIGMRQDSAAAGRVASQQAMAYKADGEVLSGREAEVVEWLKQGKSNWEVAQLMEISEDTVKYHMKSIMRKLNVVNRVQAVARVMEQEKQRLAMAMETERREINHRVKNSLSTLASLVALKRIRQKTKGAKEALADIECRFSTISELYSVLELDVKGEMVHAPPFFHQVVSLMRDGLTAHGDNVRMDVRCVDAELHHRDAFACGLIINELLSNSLKHAFSDGDRGRITVSLERDDSSGLSLSVKDNGRGFNGNPDKAASSGLELVNTLARQLGGEMVISDGDQKGMEVRVDFPGDRADAWL